MTLLTKILILCFSVFAMSLSARAADRQRTTPSPTADATSQHNKVAAPNLGYKRHGFNLRLYMGNNGTIGLASNQSWITGNPPPGTLGCEYPRGSDVEHIFGGGLWVGGILDTATSGDPREVTIVTTGYEGWAGPLWEFYPGETQADSIWVVDSPVKPAGWDEYWGTSPPFRQVSHKDFYCTYTDTFRTPVVANHIPLRIKVIQKSYSWLEYADGIIAIEYDVINVGRKRIRDAYIGYLLDGDVGPVYRPQFWQRNFTGYFANLRTAFIHNPVDRGSTPIGLTLLSTPRPLDSLTYTFRWYPGGQSPTPDAIRYQFLRSGLVMPNQSINNLSDTRFLYGFGPFNIEPAETLRVALAVVAGMNLDELRDNARRALELHQRGFQLPVIPPSPPLRLSVGFKRVELDWRWRSGLDTAFVNPESVWDDSSRVAEMFPINHWRRINPPPGSTRGGRIFEGYRVYRSEDPEGAAHTFALLKQVDDPDNNFQFNTGLEYSYVDSNLVRGKTYWYSVTSFSLPNLTVVEYPDPTDPTIIIRDTTYTPVVESSILRNQVKIDLPFSVSSRKGEVMVVPNPYRIDHDYTFEAGGWEGRANRWTENERRIKFIHLPAKCTIRIFTMAGDLVTTLHHDDPDRGDRDWDLLSESNRALASGIYVFTVESEYGTQVGKFVIIR